MTEVIEVPKTIEPDDRVSSLMDGDLECRAMGHPWALGGDRLMASRRNAPLLIERRWDCIRCTTQRFDVVNVMLWVREGHPRYVYDEAYRIKGGTVDRRALRRELYIRSSNLALGGANGSSRRSKKS